MDPSATLKPDRVLRWIFFAVGVLVVMAGFALVILPSVLYPPDAFEKVSTSQQCSGAARLSPTVAPTALATSAPTPKYRASPSTNTYECEDAEDAALRIQAASAVFSAQNGVRQALGIVVAALFATAAAAAGVLINNKTVLQAKQHHREIQAQVRSTESNDRFSAAVDQLGHSAAPVRVGALHALHQLALSQPQLRTTILEVLCAYLRQPFHHPDLDRAEGDERPLPFGRSGWTPPDSVARDGRDAEQQVRVTCAELLPDLLPSADDVRAGRESAPLLRLARSLLDTLTIQDRGFRLDVTNSYFAGSLSLSNCYIEGDLQGIDAIFGSAKVDGCDVAGEIFFEDIVVSHSLDCQGTKASSLILNGSTFESLSFSKCIFDLLDVSDCTSRSFGLDESTMEGLTALWLDGARVRNDGWSTLPKDIFQNVLDDDPDYFELAIGSDATVKTR